MVIIIVAILAFQLVINIIAVVWMSRVIVDFCHSVHIWIDQAATEIAEKLKKQNYDYLRTNESKFSKLVNMVEDKIKAANKGNKFEELKNYFVSFDVLPVNPDGHYDEACVQMITARGTYCIIPTVYLDFGDSFAWNDHYDERTMNAVETLLRQAFEEYDQIRLPNEMGRPVVFLYQAARHTSPTFAVEFGAKAIYRHPNSSNIVTETIHAVIESTKSTAIFNGQRIALYGSDIARAPNAIDRDRMIRALAAELRASDAQTSHYKATIRDLLRSDGT